MDVRNDLLEFWNVKFLTCLSNIVYTTLGTLFVYLMIQFGYDEIFNALILSQVEDFLKFQMHVLVTMLLLMLAKT